MIKLNQIYKILFLLMALSFSALTAFSATRYSRASGNWNNNNIWAATAGGSPPASAPVAGDVVYIQNGNTVTVTVNAACASITFNGANAVLTVNSSITLTLTGTITLNNITNSNSACTFSGSGSISCANVVLGSNANPATTGTTYTHTITSTISSLTVSGSVTINSYVGTNTSRRGNGVFNLQSGIVTVGGSITTSNENAVNESTFSMATGAQSGTLNIAGATAFSPSGTGTSTITLNGTTATVNYNRSGAQTVYYNTSTSTTTYTNLTLSGSNAKTISNSSTAVNGVLSMEGTATAGTNTPTYGTAATLQYKGSAAQSTGIEFPSTFGGSGGVIVNNSSGFSLTKDVTITYTLTLTSGAFNVDAYTLTLNGPAISGTATNLTTTTSSSLVFGGSSSGVSIPSSISNLNNLTINNTNGVTMNSDITLASGGTLTLTSGILEAGSHNLSVTNTSASAITSSSSSFVNVTTGSVKRTLAANILSPGTDYMFPVGEGDVYKAFNLVDALTGATGPVLQVSVSATGAVTGDNSTIGPVDPRCWSMVINSGNLTSASVELFESGLDDTKTIGMATAASGTYVSAGGTLNTSSMTSSTLTSFNNYFCIGLIWFDTYYSYQTGDWHTPSTWTSDPSGTTQIGTTVPGTTDKAVILADRTVSLSSDVTENTLYVVIDAGGVLNLNNNKFTNSLYAFSGQGTLMLASTDFPVSSKNTFVNSGGGTTEYYNASDITLPTAQTTYNNLIINCSGYTSTQLADITLNGNLHVKSGTFRINDNSATTKLNLTINGNVTVDNGAYFTVGNGVTNTAIGGTGGTAPFLNYYLNFHTVIIKGDFTNNGTVKFTNLPYPLYTAFPPTTPGSTSGAASVYFQGESDKTLTCNNSTTFYNLIVNKGTDQTYKLTINSSGYTNFRLFGANSLAAEAVTGNPTLRKALWIYSGTLILKGNLIIPSLTEGTASDADYYIPSSGALKFDGANVVVLSTADDYREVNIAYGVSAPDNTTIGITKGGYSALDVFGKLEINSGFLSTRESGGIITSSTASGQIIINGGTVDAKQLLSSTGTASYSQSAGLFILRGRFQRVPVAYSSVANLTDVTVSTLGASRVVNGINTAYGSFNLENTGNYYTVSGGTIRIYDVTLDTGGEAFDVKSSSSNISVTGGALEIIPTTGTALADATNYSVNSTAPVYDFTINRASSSSGVALSAALTVQNDFNLTAGVLTANNYNLTIGGDFTIESGTTYTPGSNTTLFNGSNNQLFTINLASALSLNNFSINKAVGKEVGLTGSQSTLNITGNFNLTTGTLNDSSKTVNIAGSVYNSGLHRGNGAIVLNGTATQTIDGAGVFQNITLNNTNAAAAPVSLVANMTINGVLTFSQNKLFNIGTYNLLLNSSASISGGSSARYIQTAGNAGDGGLTRVYPSITNFTFPVGVSTVYTPATLGFSSEPTTYGSITVKPVSYEHPVTTVKNQSLTYFWRVSSSGFTGIPLYSVTHSFVYDQTDVVGTESSYVPALYDRANFTWYYGATTNIDIYTNTITDWSLPTNSTNFLDADYTAGDVSCFGTPAVFYSRQTGLWSSTSTWSMTSHTVNDPPTAAPGANDIVIIGDNDSIYLSTETPQFPPDNNNALGAAYYQLNKAVVYCANLQIETGSVLDIQNNPGCIFASVLSHATGNGKIRLTTRDPGNIISKFDNPEPFVFPSGDFSEFNANNGISEFYTINPEAGTYYTLPSNASNYGTVILTPLGGSNIILPNISTVTILGDLICNGSDADAWLAMSWTDEYGTIVEKTVTVEGDLMVVGGTFAFIYNDNTLQQLTVEGDVYIYPDAAIDVQTTSSNNAMSIGGSLYNNSNYGTNTSSLVRFLNGSSSCDLTFSGNSSSYLTNDEDISTTPYTVFGNVTVNKGNSQATTLTWNIGGTLSTPSDDWLTLQNGTLIYDRTGDFSISQGTDFTIASTAGLTLNTGSNVYIANNTASESLFLDGKLTVGTDGGNVYIGPTDNTANNADIEYSGSGASAIEIQGGYLFVNGQVRRPTGTTNGILSYTQSGGNVIIYGNNSTVTKAKLEVLNNGSNFTMSGGTLTIVRGSGTTYGDLYLRATTSSVTGGTIVFSQVPSSGPTIDSDQSYKLDANIDLYNLTITGKTAATARTATLTLMVSPLVLKGSLTLSNSYSYFTSNNLNVSIAGNLSNSGTYTYGTNTTTFNGNTQIISGSSVTNFYSLTVSPTVSLTVNNNFTINNDLTISSGNLVLGSYKATVLGDLSNEGSYTDDNSTGGVSLEGTAQQLIAGTGYYSRLILNSSYGAKLSNSIYLHNNLVLTTGVLDINQYQLTLGQNSLIAGSSFNMTKMIKSDGVSSSPGVTKFINTGAQTLTFPVGVTGKYTPAIFTITASSTVGSIKVNPVNDYHMTVLDPLNVLNYYWQIESSGISGFNANVLLQYLVSDVAGTESDYVAAWLDPSTNTWNKAPVGPSTDNVDETNHQITFVYSGSNNLNGDYTAGSTTAIPDEIGTYETNNDGDWSDESIWTPVGATPACPEGGPVGCNVIINHVVTTDINHITALTTIINGTLRVVSPTYGHSLGVVDGDGTIYLQSGNLPAGTYTDFFDCSGNGTIEYGGSGSYTIVASLYSSLPNIKFSESGTRILPNKDITICQSLVIDGPTLDNSVNNRKLTILGTMERYNTGTFISGSGSSPYATVTFAGTTGAQTIGGTTGDFTGTNKFNNLEVNNSAGLVIDDDGAIEVNNVLLLTNGIITTSSTNTLTLLNTSPSAVSPEGGSDDSFVNGPLIKYINDGESFLYPVGKGTTLGHDFTVTATGGSTLAYTVEFFTPNSTATDLTDPLEATNTQEYWSINSTTTTTAKVKIGWDPTSDLTPLMTTNGITDMRVAEYITDLWTELTSITSGDEYYGDVSVTNSVSIYTTVMNFTTGAVAGTLAKASFNPSGPVCGSDGIPVSFTYFDPITLNYTLDYTIDGVPQTTITVTSLPYTLPTPSAGDYILTGFKYNNVTITGVVDATEVTVYDYPTTSNAGSDQSNCGLSSTTLEGNDPVSFPGIWTVVSGTGGSFDNSTQYNTVFNGINGSSYTLRWTISNSSCTSEDDVAISFPITVSTPGNFTVYSSTVCRETGGYVYTVPNVSGVTYNWSYSGTGHTITGSGNSVSIAFDASATSGTLSVTASNSCGTSAPRTLAITVVVASFNYPANPYCQNASDPSPVFTDGGVAGTFSSTTGLVFVSTATGQVDLSASISGTYTVTNSVVSGSCGTVEATNTITISGQTWTGASGTDWNDAGNWSCGFIPYPTTTLEIPDVANEPIINTGSPGTVNNLVIDANSSLTVKDNTIQISGTITNNGTFDVTDGIVEINGSVAQSIGTGAFSNGTIKNLTINNVSGVTLLDTLKVTGVVLVSNGNLASDGYLILRSTASGTALIDGSGTGNVTGIVTMQRYLPSGFGYKYFSSPFQAATVNEFGDDINLALPSILFYKYDENRLVGGVPASGWVNYKTTTNVLYPLSGYTVNLGSSSAEKTIDIKGVVNNGSMSVTLYNHNQTYTKGFNLVGNPYPSPIDWDAASGWTKTNIDDAVYYFKASPTEQYLGTYSSYINGISSDGEPDRNIIPSMQGFFIHVSDGGYPVTATLGMDNDIRITDQEHVFTKGASSGKGSYISSGKNPSVSYSKSSSVPLLRINASFEDYSSLNDPAIIYYDDMASEGFESNLDAIKLYNSNTKVPNLYSVAPDSKKLAISALPSGTETPDSIPLGLKTNRSGYVVFKITEIDTSLTTTGVYLTDMVTGIEQDMLNGQQYKVYLTTGEYNNRFFLHYTHDITTNTENRSDDLFKIYCSDGKLIAEIYSLSGDDGTIMIHNLIGQKLFVKKVYETGYYEFDPCIKDGVYIVSYISGTTRNSKKIFIKN